MSENPFTDGQQFSAARLNSMYNAHQNEGVLNGLDASTSVNAFDVDVASGNVFLNGTNVSVGATTVSHSTSDPEDRIDLLSVDSTGAVNITQGNPAATAGQPVAPDIPTDEILISLVYVRGGSSEILTGDIFNDYRVTLATDIPAFESPQGDFTDATVANPPSNATDVVRKSEIDPIESTLADKQDSVSANNTIFASSSGSSVSDTFDSQGGLVLHIDVTLNVTVNSNSINEGDIELRIRDSEGIIRASKRTGTINQGDSVSVSINRAALAGISGTGEVEAVDINDAAYDDITIDGSVTGVL